MSARQSRVADGLKQPLWRAMSEDSGQQPSLDQPGRHQRRFDPGPGAREHLAGDVDRQGRIRLDGEIEDLVRVAARSPEVRQSGRAWVSRFPRYVPAVPAPTIATSSGSSVRGAAVHVISRTPSVMTPSRTVALDSRPTVAPHRRDRWLNLGRRIAFRGDRGRRRVPVRSAALARGWSGAFASSGRSGHVRDSAGSRLGTLRLHEPLEHRPPH